MLDEKRYLTRKEVCEYTGFSRSTIQRAMRDDKFPWTYLRGRKRFDKVKVDKYFELRSSEKKSPALA